MRLASRGGSYSDMLFAVNASTPIEQKLAEALAECDRLQEENRQLRGRLGISSEKKPVRPTSTPAEQVAWVINCQPHDISVLVAARLLKPLGNPTSNAIKFFATCEVMELSKDKAWLVKVTTAIDQHWHQQNSAKKNGMVDACVVHDDNI